MDIDGFWNVVGVARAESSSPHGKAFAEALVDQLAGLSQEEILGYQERFDEVHGAVYRWDVWAAAYLIGGGCSDDSFMDFRAGLVALGRDWYELVAARPDDLADHPAVIEAAARGDDYVIFAEDVNYAANYAFERLTGDADAFHAAWKRHRAGQDLDAALESDMGEDFDFDDADEMHRRLPHLAETAVGLRSLQLRQVGITALGQSVGSYRDLEELAVVAPLLQTLRRGLAPGKREAADRGAWIAFEDEAGQSMAPPRARTWGRVGCTPVVRVRSRGSGRLSMVGMCCFKPGSRSRLIYGLREYRGRKDEPKGFGWKDFCRLLVRARIQLGGRIVLVWDNVRLHLTRGMREFIEKNADWLTVFQLPTYAPDLNPQEGIWSLVKRVLGNIAAADLSQITRAVKRKLKQIQYHPDLADGCLAGGGLTIND
ncbi:DUF4240 domain-containing protein [Actinacidiphila cocklensis]|uniref:Transposase n=1 Tax=Actinacidiphila cocklensis TaxID=887465 RepID=A0A9W4E3A6_9ACTN|nr:DUF4240 domain-containing protein [Actinacidiphila cocklensis]CAG6398662.1 hypothetical protein SCOCK_720022 [Actinacidiphila cocklensis]